MKELISRIQNTEEFKGAFVYALINKESEIYIGYTTDLQHRIDSHNNNTGAVATKMKGPWHLFLVEYYLSVNDAKDREKELIRSFDRGNFLERTFWSRRETMENLGQTGVDWEAKIVNSKKNELASFVSNNAKGYYKLSKEQLTGKVKRKSKASNFPRFFKIEDYTTFNPTRTNYTLKSLKNLTSKRKKNKSEGKLLNHGIVVTTEEILMIIKMYKNERNLDIIENFFQRSKKTIVVILEHNGCDL